jgi:acetyl-CoA carboxylase carboxyltransferase component
MSSRHLGADVVLAWKGAELGVMGPHAAVGLIHARRLTRLADPAATHERLALDYACEQLGVNHALAAGSIDAVIAPRETRVRVADALDVRTGQSARSSAVSLDLASSHEAAPA